MRSDTRPLGLSYGQGLLMGGADIIPGVSGGTVALVVGIYEPLIASISSVAHSVASVLRGDLRAARERLGTVHWRLVLPLGLGILTALVIGAVVIESLLERYPVQTSALFFGLIAGAVAIPWRRIERHTAREYAVAAGAALVAFLLVGLPPQEIAAPTPLMAFGAAAVAICAMILPGVSGAFLLLVLGMYEPTLGAVRALDIPYILAFVAGAAVGLGLFSRVLTTLLSRHHEVTMAALVGLMIGSLRALWPWLDADRGLQAPPSDVAEVATAAAIALAGFVAVTLLDRLGNLSERRAVPPSAETTPKEAGERDRTAPADL